MSTAQPLADRGRAGAGARSGSSSQRSRAALTFADPVPVRGRVGAVAEQRIRSGFDDELRATSADLVDEVGPPAVDETGHLSIRGAPLRFASAGGALVRVVDSQTGEVLYPIGSSGLVSPGTDGVVDIGDYRVVSRPLVKAVRQQQGLFEPPTGSLRASVVAYLQYAKPEVTMTRTIARVRTVPRLRRARRRAAGVPRRAAGGAPGDAADRRPHARGARGRAHAQPGRQAARLGGQRRGRGPRPHARGHARRAERRPRRDRVIARAPARVRRRRLARAAHAADEHPRQPRAADNRARGRAARDGDVGAALLAAHAPAGRRPAAARPRRRRSRGADTPDRPRRDRPRGRYARPPRCRSRTR